MIAFALPLLLFFPAVHFTPVPGLPGFLPVNFFLIGALLFTVLLIELRTQEQKRAMRLKKVDLAVIALVVTQLPSLITSFEARISLRVFYQWSVGLSVYLFICQRCTWRDLRYLYRGVSMALLLAATAVAIQFITDSTWPVTAYLNDVLEEERSNLRLSSAKTIGLFLHANSQSLMFTILIPLVVGFWVSSRRSSRDRLLAGTAIFVSTVAELLTLSRAGIATLAITLGIMYLIHRRNARRLTAGMEYKMKRSRLRMLPSVFVILALISFFGSGISSTVIDRFTSSEHAERDEGSNFARVVNLTAGVNATAAHPVFGIGPGMSPTTYSRFGGWDGFGAHNTYVSLSSESGIPVAIIYVCILLYFLRQSLRSKRLRAPSDYSEMALRLGCMGALISVILNGFFETITSDVFICVIFSIFALTHRLNLPDNLSN